MIDFHTHTLLSDGLLCPAELVQRAKEHGYRALGITDHVDPTNLEWVVPSVVKFCKEIREIENEVKVIPGVELTHLPPSLIRNYADKARKMGAKLVVVHGETIVEPVPEGTNRAALEADIDILAHPGLIKEEDVILASERGIYLEITPRKGHCLTNGRVAFLARKYGAKLLFNTDAHSPQDLVKNCVAEKILRGAGLDLSEVKEVFKNSQNLLERLL